MDSRYHVASFGPVKFVKTFYALSSPRLASITEAIRLPNERAQYVGVHRWHNGGTLCKDARSAQCHFVLYETRKLVKCVIMLDGGQQGRGTFLPLRQWSRSRVRCRLSACPFSSFSPSSLKPRLIPPSASYSGRASLTWCRRLVRSRLDHTRSIALSLLRSNETLTRESFRQLIE